MKQLNLKSEIHYFDTCEQFIGEFNITDQDLIFTNEFNYRPFAKHITAKPMVIFKENYSRAEPTDLLIDNIIFDISSFEYNRVIAIGGGSIIDIAKVLALSNVSSTESLFLRQIPILKEKPLVVIPTTVGTGSEVTNVTITAMESMETKLGLADDRLFPDYAVLIPEALQNLPFSVFVTSSIDALVHASESFLSPKATPFSRMYSIEAIKLILTNYQKIVAEGKDSYKKYLKEFLYASNYAGLAFGLAGTAVVHAMAYPLGGKYHVPHGEANYQFFVACFKKYLNKKSSGEIDIIIRLFAELLACEKSEALDRLNSLLASLLPQKALCAYGMADKECADFAKNVIESQQRLLVNSFVPLSEAEIEQIYRERLLA